MDSHEALKAVEAIVAAGKARRVSSPERTTKAIIFQTLSGRNFAVELNEGVSHGTTGQVKLVLERAPDGAELDWDEAAALLGCLINDRQFRSSVYNTLDANLQFGKQVSVLVTTALAIEHLVDWYAAAAPIAASIADRIRAHAVSHYVAPARARGDRDVAVRVGTLHDELRLVQNHANVYQALNGPIFRSLTGLAPPTVTGPKDSSNAIFTYSLERQVVPMIQPPASATNLILYGPPGTGKTYATAAEAVRLCLGDAEAAPLLVPAQRDALMKKYRELAEAGRIDFITFHQSYSYEDFVEGLRPTTDADGVPADIDEALLAAPSGGFRLRSEDGIFKLICARARRDGSEVESDVRLDRQRRIFKMSLGRRNLEEDRIDDGLKNNLIHLGYGQDIDWSPGQFAEFDRIRSKWQDEKDANATSRDPNIQMIYSLRNDMRIGDYVVVSDGRDAIRAFGKVTGEYYYDPTAAYHPHRRKVAWIWQSPTGVQRNIFYSKNFRQHSIYRLGAETIDWDALEKLVLGTDAPQPVANARPYVLVIDEINRANISKVFGELITLLEPDKRLGEINEVKVRLPYSDGPPFGVPANLHIVGTMNTADRSIALLDTALRRRFTFRELMPQPALLDPVDGIDLALLLTTLNERIEYLFDREHQIGHAYFIGCKTRSALDEIMRHKVIPLLAEYFYEDWNKVAAVLGDASDGEGDRAGGFLDRKKLACPRGLGGDGDAAVRFRWSVREQFDYTYLVQ